MTAHFPTTFTGRKTLYLADPGAQRTLADAIALLREDEELSSVRRRDLISARCRRIRSMKLRYSINRRVSEAHSVSSEPAIIGSVVTKRTQEMDQQSKSDISPIEFAKARCRVRCRDSLRHKVSTMASKSRASERLLVRRGLSESEAAIYLSLSATFFRKLVEQGVMPRPRLIGSRRIWDVDELDIAFRALPREGGEESVADSEGDNSWADFK